jgi:ligand-binding sensor domain-containing protein
VGVAIDANRNAWVANFDNAVVSKLDSTGAPLSGAGYRVPADVASIAVDGSNTIWTANADGSVSHLSNTGAALSPMSGYISNGATAEVGIAIDASGNVWTTDNYVDSLFEYIGAASPAVVPLQAAVKNNQLGRRP